MDLVTPDGRKALKRIASTDYVYSAIVEHKRYIADLEELIADYNDIIIAADRAREKSIQNADMSGIVLSETSEETSGATIPRDEDPDDRKIQAVQISTEEREQTFDTVYRQLQDQVIRASLMDMQSEAQNNLFRLKTKQSRHTDSLHEVFHMGDKHLSIPHVREQDLLATIHTTQNQYDRHRCEYVSIALTIIVLTKARARLREALTATSESYSEFLIGIVNRQSHRVPIERAALTQADRMCMEAQILTAQAFRMVSIKEPMPILNISLKKVLCRYYFDTFTSDQEFRENIMQDAAKITEYLNALEGLEKNLKLKKSNLKKEVGIAKESLEEARLNWQIARDAMLPKDDQSSSDIQAEPDIQT